MPGFAQPSQAAFPGQFSDLTKKLENTPTGKGEFEKGGPGGESSRKRDLSAISSPRKKEERFVPNLEHGERIAHRGKQGKAGFYNIFNNEQS